MVIPYWQTRKMQVHPGCLNRSTLVASASAGTMPPGLDLEEVFVNVYWVAVKELKLRYYIGETLLFTIYTHYGNLI